MKNVFICLLLFSVAALSYWTGKEKNQKLVESRALELTYKTCYDWQDVEIILFGETQE